MSDRLHDHLTLGFRPGCVACAQVEADLALSRKAFYAQVGPAVTGVVHQQVG